MLGPNILAACLKPLIGKTKVVWGIRTAGADWRVYGRRAALAARVESLLARFADLIICNSEAGRRTSLKQGFPIAKLIVIPNGIDTERFRPDEVARRTTRAAWGVKEDEPLVGTSAALTSQRAPLFLPPCCGNKLPGARPICVAGPDALRAL
jgi:glycosyltransferase involved in cell wall biosynthesis